MSKTMTLEQVRNFLIYQYENLETDEDLLDDFEFAASSITAHLAAREQVPENRTIYDHRIAVEDACRNAAPKLYHALSNLLDAVKERRGWMGIESAVISDADNALLAAAPSQPAQAADAKPCAYCGAVDPVEWVAPAPNKEGA